MKKFITAVAASALVLTLTSCAGPGDDARSLAAQWLDGDASAQCLGQASPWEKWELRDATLIETTDTSEIWSVELIGMRKGRPVDDGYVLVEVRNGGGESCVKWTQP
ncbi:hypothetical protein [uncultured Microbacterium sp.]|uniref:hypothetical protein n=1 Tax=uncultured Microbacterium sp. TaxID=191216 RepID=UPI0028DCAEEA|nr:hypothetical protein [uncultured Microbacterium sp.]